METDLDLPSSVQGPVRGGVRGWEVGVALTQGVDLMWGMGWVSSKAPLLGRIRFSDSEVLFSISQGHSALTSWSFSSHWPVLSHLDDAVKCTKTSQTRSHKEGQNKTSGSIIHSLGSPLA